MANRHPEKSRPRRTRSVKNDTKAIVANKRTKSGPQKAPSRRTAAALAARRPRTRQQTREEEEESVTRITLRPGLVLTCTAGEVKAGTKQTVEHNNGFEQERGSNHELHTNRRNLQASRVKLRDQEGNKTGVRIRRSGHGEGILEQVTMTVKGKTIKGKHRQSYTTLVKQLEQMARDLGDAQDRILELQNTLAGKEAELAGTLSFLNHGNSLSGADAIDLANSLNADILQGAAHIADMLDSSTFLTDHETESYKCALQQAHMSLGRELAEALTSEANWGSDKFVVQIALQVCMVTFCVNVIRSWSPEESENGVLADMYARVVAKESQSVAGRWRSLTRGITQQARDPEVLRNVIIDTITDILVVAGCWEADREGSPRELFEKFYENLGRIVEGALKLQVAVGLDITCMDIEPLTVCPGSPFDHKSMEDAYAGQDTEIDDLDRVLCTTELGLSQAVKHPESTYQDILLRPKILLQSALQTRGD